jgi:hypothetical protein
MVKFMQSLDLKVEKRLRRIAKSRGISLQELLRSIIIPEWMEVAEIREALRKA